MYRSATQNKHNTKKYVEKITPILQALTPFTCLKRKKAYAWQVFASCKTDFTLTIKLFELTVSQWSWIRFLVVLTLPSDGFSYYTGELAAASCKKKKMQQTYCCLIIKELCHITLEHITLFCTITTFLPSFQIQMHCYATTFTCMFIVVINDCPHSVHM